MKLFCVLLMLLCLPVSALESHGRFSGWSIYDPKFYVSNIDIKHLDVIYYDTFKLDHEFNVVASDNFADLQQRSDSLLRHVSGNLAQLVELRKANPESKILLAIGGFAYSQYFSGALATPEQRKLIINQLEELKTKYKIDGFDFNWRFPIEGNGEPTQIHSDPNDGRNYNRLLREIRDLHKDWILSIHLPSDPISIVDWDIRYAQQYVDYLQVPGFNLHGPWEPLTYYHNALYTNANGARVGQQSVDGIVLSYLTLGITAQKMVLNVAPVAMRYNGANGVYSKWTTIPRSEWQQAGYYALPQTVTQQRAWTWHWDEDSRVNWLTDELSGDFINLETARSLREKIYYALVQQLAGVSLNELHNDYRDNNALLEVLDDARFEHSIWYLELRAWWKDNQKPLLSWVIVILSLLLLSSSMAWILYRWWIQLQDRQKKIEFSELYQQLDQLFDASLQTQTLVNLIEIQGLDQRLTIPNMIDRVAVQSQEQIKWLNHFHWHLKTPKFAPLMQQFCLGELLQPLAQQMHLELDEAYFSWTITANYRQIWHTLLQFEQKLGAPTIQFHEHQNQLQMQLSFSIEALGAHQLAILFDWLHQHKNFGLLTDFKPSQQTLNLSWWFNALAPDAANNKSKVVVLESLPDRIAALQQDWQHNQDPDSQIEAFLQFFDDYGALTGRTLNHQTSGVNLDGHQVWQHEFKDQSRTVQLFSRELLDSREQWLFHALATQLELMQESLRQLVKTPQLLNELYTIANRKEQLLCIKADHGYSQLIFSLQKNSQVISLRLRQIQQYFDHSQLLQVHRSWLVNPNKVKRIVIESKRKWWVEIDNHRIPVGQKYMPSLKANHPFWFSN